METKILKANRRNVKIAAEQIKNGGVVAFATETVYGLGADARNEQAVKQIFSIKGRPNDNPLIVHLSSVKDIERVAYVDKRAKRLIKKFMPGALTIILRAREGIAPSVTCGLKTVAVRIPKNKAAQMLIKAAGVPVAAPSANSSTKPSPTCANHVYDDLKGKLGYVLDGGQCAIGLESTIVDFSGEEIRLLRRGGIGAERLRRFVNELKEPQAHSEQEKPISPGLKYIHYSPLAAVFAFDYGNMQQLQQLKDMNSDKKTMILSLTKIKDAVVFKSVRAYARRLFYLFRFADKQGVQVIICERPPMSGLGGAINNRITKASGGGNKNHES